MTIRNVKIEVGQKYWDNGQPSCPCVVIEVGEDHCVLAMANFNDTWSTVWFGQKEFLETFGIWWPPIQPEWDSKD